jgi:hypothetical protein
MAFNRCQMMHEAPRPETYQAPEASIFNVEAMGDEQIILLHRGLISAHDSEDIASGKHDRDVADSMLSQLRAELGALASRDPRRVRGLVEQSMQSDKGYDHEFAQRVAPSLLDYDYEFVRDTMISLSTDGSELASEGAYLAIHEEIRDRLTPEQVADFNAHLEARGEHPMQPDRHEP